MLLKCEVTNLDSERPPVSQNSEALTPSCGTLVSRISPRSTHSPRAGDMPASYRSQRALLSVVGSLIFYCSGVAADSRVGRPVLPANGVVRVPVVDGQDIRFTQISMYGEPFPAEIQSITQDNYGFLWVGTEGGLYRYDGYSLRPYQHDRNDPTSLSDSRIRVVYRDREGILWTGGGNQAGLDRLDPAENTFRHYRHDPADNRSLSDDGVGCVYQDRNGALWVGTRGGLNRLDPATGTFVRYYPAGPDAGSQSSNNISSIVEDRAGNLWVGTRDGLVKLDRVSGRFSQILEDPANPRSVFRDFVSSISEDHSGLLWMGAVGVSGLNSLDAKTGTFTRYSFYFAKQGNPAIPDVTKVYEDGDGVLWLCTRGGGLLKLNRQRNQAIRYRRRPENPNSLHNDVVQTVFEDAEGTMWVGTWGGLSRFPGRPLQFVNYLNSASTPAGRNDELIRAVQGDSRGLLWIATDRGLGRLDRKTGQLAFYRHDVRNVNGLSADIVNAIREGRSGTLWFGTKDGGLNRFDTATGRSFGYQHDPLNPATLSNDRVSSLLVDRQGQLWVGTEGGGLNRFDSTTGHFTRYRYGAGDHQNLVDNIKAIFEDHAGSLWLGTQGGLNRFDPKTYRFTLYTSRPHDSHSLSHDDVTAVREDRRQRLWVGTRRGLNLFDPSQGTFSVFTTKDGLPSDIIEAILEDNQGFLWLATHNGLSRFDPQTRNFRTYSEADGLPSNFLAPFGVEGSWRSKDGEMFFGSTKGLTTFYPDRLSPGNYVPPVVLTDFQLFNKPVQPGAGSPLHKPIWATDSLILTHTQNIFTLEFAGLSYAAPEKNRYRYRLEGLESEWNEVDGRRRQATYTGLSAGHYVFRAQACSKDGVWNEKGVTLAITVLPPLWATWWFRSITGFVIAGAILAAYKARVRGLNRTAVTLEAQVAQRTRELEIAKEVAERANAAKSTFLATMSHELRTPLNAILGFSAIVRDSPDLRDEHRRNLQIVNRSGENLLSLIDDVLDMAKIEAGSMTLEKWNFDVASLVRDNIDMMRAHAGNKGLELFFESSLTPPWFVRADAGKLRQVLTNLLSNAVKFTQRGSVTVRLALSRMDSKPIDDQDRAVLILEVEDTGIGIDKEDQARIFDIFVQAGKTFSWKGTGLGLSITKELVQLMGGTISVHSATGKGSLFKVELPVEQVQTSDLTAEDDGRQVLGLAPGQPDCRILIVEDKKENWLLLQRLLLEAGFQVQVAEDGLQAIKIFRTWQPHLIWMDIRLPMSGGREVTAKIRALDGGEAVRIVGLSASAFAHEREDVLAAGMDDFLRKPFRREEILEVMARQLGIRYSYAQAQPVRSTDSCPPFQADLSTLPQKLCDDLANAVLLLDPGKIGEVIDRVAHHDAQLGEVLSRAAGRLQYTPILEALEQRNLHRGA